MKMWKTKDKEETPKARRDDLLKGDRNATGFSPETREPRRQFCYLRKTEKKQLKIWNSFQENTLRECRG